ncbi:hypothetical protein AVEN_196398-1 [Araneus ventricosus]|uniref:Uncharacterized protein n=1 Tax=Araneus ventricosus TaxID=182803 RepID=A0A4Y2AXH6_ARAVE|nr:hypothetical protein AVEN_196398-1 [Araneus ventricosus]
MASVWSIFRPLHLSDGRCNSPRVLVTITGHGPTRRRHALSLAKGKPKSLLYPPGKRDPAYLSGGFSSTYSWCPILGPLYINKHNILLITTRTRLVAWTFCKD